MKAFRQNSLYITEEVYTILKIVAKSKMEGTTGDMTADALADCLLREKISTDYPKLVVLYADLESEKQKARTSYQNVEKKMMDSVRTASQSQQPSELASDSEGFVPE